MKFLPIILSSIFTLGLGYTNPFLSDLEKASEKVGVPVKLLSAICYAESKHRPWAHNPDDPSGGAFGICQVLYSTAGQYVKKDERCLKRFSRYDKVNNVYENCILFGSYTSAYVGAKFLKERLDRNNGDWLAAIAGYNSGTAKYCHDGWIVRAYDGKKLYKNSKTCPTSKEGKFINQGYVNEVLKALSEGR